MMGGQPILIKERQFSHEPSAKYLAEFVGTFFLVFTVGCNVHTGSIGAAISIGGILMVMVYALGPVSGGHLNPAVTAAIGLSGRGKISFENMLCYMAAQIAGGIFGALNYWIIFNDAFLLRPVAGYTHGDAACAEILYTMALCYVVLNVATTENKEQGNVGTKGIPNSFFGLAIGLTVTSAAIAVGPISGCSLNPAVSIGALFASKLAHGTTAVNMIGLYVFAPFFGAALAALFFFFVQGGLTGQYEYEMGPSRPASRIQSPVVSRSASPAPVYRQPIPQPIPQTIMPRELQFLKKGQIFYIPKEAEHHTIFFGLSWKVGEGFGSTDCDASCVKFTSEGRLIEGIYFENKNGNEDKKNDTSIIRHHGDSVTGKGEGFGFVHEHHKHGQVHHIKDDERIEIRHLAKLRQHQPRCTYMFFVINVFTSQQKFDTVQDMTIRLVDEDDDKREVFRFEKKDMKKNQKNAFVLGVLFWRADRWLFQVIDEPYQIKDFATYREFEPKLRSIVRQMEGLEPSTF